MTRRHTHHSRVVGKFVRIPEPLADGKVRCPACSKVLTPTEHGGIRAHRDGYGDPCAYRYSGLRDVQLDETPPVEFRGRVPGPSREKRAPTEPSRLDAGSNCRECDKWLPGERSLCGACAVKLEKGRQR